MQNFEHPVYEQLFAAEAGFLPGLSVVDLLFNCGPAAAGLIGRSAEG